MNVINSMTLFNKSGVQVSMNCAFALIHIVSEYNTIPAVVYGGPILP